MENGESRMDCLDEQNNLIDRLEDEIIDHPSAGAGTNQFSDESFQHKLNERANQIQQGSEWSSSDPSDPYPDHNSSSASYQFLYAKPSLVYEYSDCGELLQELDQWFVSSDFALLDLNQLKEAQLPALDLEKSSSLASLDLWQPSPYLDLVLYFILGLGLFLAVIRQLGQTLDKCIAISDEQSDMSYTEGFTLNFFKLLTVVYFSLTVALKSSGSVDHILPSLLSVDLLSRIVKLSELWKIGPSPHLRIRNCLLLHWKLMLVEFGGSRQISLADDYLCSKYKVKNKDRKLKETQKLACSRVDYYTFEEDLKDKYPLGSRVPEVPLNQPGNESTDAQSLSTTFSDLLSLSEDMEFFMAANLHSNSLSSRIDVPRTNKLHSVYGSLPGQTVHIATPVPSPPSTPSEFMSGGEKVRKLYHVNQGLPFIYPFADEQKIPEAITEASQLIQQGVYESYLAKRLSRERALFLAKERDTDCHEGLSRAGKFLPASPADEAPNSLEFKSAVESLKRVEEYYLGVLKHLRSFVDVLMNVLKTSKVETNLRDIEKELDPDSSFTHQFGCDDNSNSNELFSIIYHQLDLLRAKEITLKAVSGILILTLRWFKLSHPLKAYYFSSLLFDAGFPNIFIEFLADSFNNPALQNLESENKGMLMYDVLSSQNRLLNPSFDFAQLSFFKFCRDPHAHTIQKVTLINNTALGTLPQKVDEANKSSVEITSFNRDFCFILINLLNVMNKVLIKNILQRVFVFNDSKPTDLLKIILINYVNEDLRKPILKIFKKITPYQGRKWRALNMDVVSLIFLNVNLSLRDNWLSGKDLENEFKDSLEQELSLRSLLQFYNTRNYPEEMRGLGYMFETKF